MALSRALLAVAGGLWLSACASGPAPSAIVTAAFEAGNRQWSIDEASRYFSADVLGRLAAHHVSPNELWTCATGMYILARLSISGEEIHGDRATVAYQPVFLAKPAMWCTWGFVPDVAPGQLVFPTGMPCFREDPAAQARNQAAQRAADALCKLTGSGCRRPASPDDCVGPPAHEVLVREEGQWRLSLAPDSGLGMRLICLDPKLRAVIEDLDRRR